MSVNGFIFIYAYIVMYMVHIHICIYLYVCVWPRDDNISRVCVWSPQCVCVWSPQCVCVWSPQYRGISYDRKGDLKQAIENFSEVRMSDIYVSRYVHIHTCKGRDSFIWHTHTGHPTRRKQCRLFPQPRVFKPQAREISCGYSRSWRIYVWVMSHI